MNLHRTKIEWCTHTWNPVTGCLHGCDYCYARRMTARFKPHGCEHPMIDKDSGATGILNEQDSPGCYVITHPVKLADETGKYIRTTQFPKGFAPAFHAHTLNFPSKREIPSRIFVSSMGDLFGKWVPDKWIETVFDSCKQAPQHTYMFLTKNPQRYMDLAQAGKLPMAPNFWYGSTITGPGIPIFWSKEVKTFVSIEPILAPFSEEGIAEDNPLESVDWVVVGAMTGPGSRKHQPTRENVEVIVRAARDAGTPMFMKDSLADIWGDNLIREYPEGMPLEDLKGHKRPPHCKECELATATKQGKRGTTYVCEIGWKADGYHDRPARHVPGRYTRTSPPWCPRRGGAE